MADQALKDSGQAWLGEIPSHWALRKIGAHFTERKVMVNDTDYPALSVTMQGIVPQIDTAAKSDANDKRKQVLAGDFVINSRSDRKGSSGISALDGSVSQIAIVLEPKEISAPYVHYLLRSFPFQEEFYKWGSGIVADLWSTRFSAMKQIQIPVPPPAEQDEIVAFLDRELVKLDLLWDKCNQLLGSLDELRVSIVDQALAQIKSTDITKIKYACLLNCSPKRSSETFVDFFPMDAISEWNGLRFGDQIDSSEASSGYSLIRENDVVIAKVTPCFENRKGTVIPKLASDFALATTEVLVLTPTRDFESKFIRFVLTSSKFIKEGERSMTGAGGLKRIPSSFLANYVIPKISREEQRNFVSLVESKMQTLTTLESSLGAATELLKMRRIALVSAAVTGKIAKGSV